MRVENQGAGEVRILRTLCGGRAKGEKSSPMECEGQAAEWAADEEER
jgi:hypothetical protein